MLDYCRFVIHSALICPRFAFAQRLPGSGRFHLELYRLYLFAALKYNFYFYMKEQLIQVPPFHFIVL